MTKIKGNNDGPGGRNETFDIGKGKAVSRSKVVKEDEAGLHSGAHVLKINNRKNARDNPDQSKKNNVNRK
jgi:hypothetical protein